MPQPRDRLENGRSEDDKMPRKMWKVVEASSGEVRMGKTEGGRSERRSRKKTRRKEKEEEAENRKDSRSEEDSRGMGNMGWRRGGSKIRGRSKKVGARKISQVDKSIWEKTIRKDAVTNFIQLVSPQPVDRLLQTKLRWKAPNEGYPHVCGMYKSDNK